MNANDLPHIIQWFSEPEIPRQEELTMLNIMILDAKTKLLAQDIPKQPPTSTTQEFWDMKQYHTVCNHIFDAAEQGLGASTEIIDMYRQILEKSPLFRWNHSRVNLLQYEFPTKAHCHCMKKEDIQGAKRKYGSFPLFPIYYKYIKEMKTSQHSFVIATRRITEGQLDPSNVNHLKELFDLVNDHVQNPQGCSDQCDCYCAVCGSLRADVNSLQVLASMINHSLGMKPSPIDSLAWSCLGAVQDDSRCLGSLGYFFDDMDPNAQSYHLFVRQCWRRAGILNDPIGQYNMKCVYGMKAHSDIKLYYNWRLLAALNGDNTCVANYARQTCFHPSSQEDNELSQTLILKAAQAGDNECQYVYAYILFNNSEEITAFKWFKVAAINGNKKAHRDIGWMLHRGRGCEKNVDLAYQHYILAAASGSIAACRDLSRFYELSPLYKNNFKAYYWKKMGVTEKDNTQVQFNVDENFEKEISKFP